MLCFLPKEESVDTFLVVDESLGDCADDSSLGVAAQSWLQDPCQFWISVVDKRLGRRGLAQLIYHIGQGQEAPVYVGALPEAQPFRLGPVHAFTPCQVHQVKLRNPLLIVPESGGACDVNAEHCVGPARLLIELRLRYDLRLIPLQQVLHYLLAVLHIALWEPVDVDALGYAFSDLQVLVGWLDQVVDALIVDL